jgi:hypothetical protein
VRFAVSVWIGFTFMILTGSVLWNSFAIMYTIRRLAARFR